MNPICKFCSNGSCQSGNKCVNRHEELALKMDVEYPELDFGATGTTRKQVEQIPIIDLTTEPTTAVVYDDCKNAGPKSNELYKTKSMEKQQLEQDLEALRNENAKLIEQIVILGTSTNTLTEQLKEEKKKNAKVTEEFYDDEYQCCICLELFIRPSVLNCSHMFCEWCIDKWLEIYDHCPTCRFLIISYTHCLTMNNIIQKRMELMPADVRSAFKELEVARAGEKQRSLQILAERKRLEQIKKRLNGQSSN